MLKQTDLLLLLSGIEKAGIPVGDRKTKVLTSSTISMDILRFINENRPLQVTNFYEQLRKSYNAKRSSLFKNIVKELSEPFDVLTTLSSLSLQIFLFAKHLPEEDIPMFLSHSRGEEITRVLNNYYKTYDLMPCIELLKLIRADCKVFQAIIK